MVSSYELGTLGKDRTKTVELKSSETVLDEYLTVIVSLIEVRAGNSVHYLVNVLHRGKVQSLRTYPLPTLETAEKAFKALSANVVKERVGISSNDVQGNPKEVKTGTSSNDLQGDLVRKTGISSNDVQGVIDYGRKQYGISSNDLQG